MSLGKPKLGLKNKRLATAILLVVYKLERSVIVRVCFKRITCLSFYYNCCCCC